MYIFTSHSKSTTGILLFEGPCFGILPSSAVKVLELLEQQYYFNINTIHLQPYVPLINNENSIDHVQNLYNIVKYTWVSASLGFFIFCS